MTSHFATRQHVNVREISSM